MAKVNLSVSVKDEHLGRFTEVVKELKKAGLDVGQELESLGVVTGSIDSGRISALKNIPGVAQVEESRTVGIPPPDSKVQ